VKTSTVLTADTSAVTVGTLAGSALFSAITSAINNVCEVPKNTGGATGSFTCRETATATVVSDVKATEEGALGGTEWSDDGILTLQIIEGNYDSIEWYESSKVIIAAFAGNSTQGWSFDPAGLPAAVNHANAYSMTGNCPKITTDGLAFLAQRTRMRRSPYARRVPFSN
jgi:hypothetical protein